MYRNKITGETKENQPAPYRAKFQTTCVKCSKLINRGDCITWPRSGGTKGAYHQDCSDPRNSPWSLIIEDKPTESLPSFPIPPSIPAIPEEFNGDKAFDMEIPSDDSPSFADEEVPAQKQASAKVSASDGLLDIISQKVEEKVITDIRRKVNSAMDALDRSVKEKLDKLHVPSIIIKRPDMPEVKIDNVHKQFTEILEYLNSGSYVYAHGAPGAGKSDMGPKLAQALGVRYGYMSLCEQTPEYVVRGCVLVNGEFYQPPFIDFVKNGGLWAWEEADNSNDNLRNSLNTLLENKKVHLDNGEAFTIHEKFYLLMNGNTCGRGAHPAFPSRTAFDAAFAARFEFVEFVYDWDLCKHVALGINAQAGPIVKWAESASAWALANSMALVISPREVYKLAFKMAITKIPSENLFDAIIIKGLDIVSKEKLLANHPFPSIVRSN